MNGETVVAPALSTTQAEETFNLGRVTDTVKDRHSYLGCNPTTHEDLVVHLRNHYRVDDIVRFLNENKHFNKITLQFPDSLVQDAAIIAQLLQQNILDHSAGESANSKLKSACKSGDQASGCCQKSSDEGLQSENRARRVWILADTAYSACCVDEVASEHVNGDLVIHFGDACLNAVQKLPVLYCFGNPYLDLEATAVQFQKEYSDLNEKVVLMANAPYSCHLKALHENLRSLGYSNVLFSNINKDYAGPNASFVGLQSHESSSNAPVVENRVILGLDEISGISSEEFQSDYSLFHITIPEDPRLLFLTTKFKSLKVYDPVDNTVSGGPFPSMMKRYKFMHEARTAGTIGILVNTLSLRNTNETIKRVAKLIKENGKKHYMFVVGKPNVAKLANFEAIDVWCILGCGQSGIIVDQFNEFLKPIITPYELTLALNPEVTWTGQWLVDFKQVLQEIENEDDDDDDDDDRGEEGKGEGESERNDTPLAEHNNDNFESEAPEFNAVSGRYVNNSRPLRNLVHVNIQSPEEPKSTKSNQLVEKFSGAVTIGNTFSTSASYLQQRQWTGLGSDFTPENYEEEGATLEEGGSGIASQYQFDKQNKN
ncbi:LADA_0H13740g1_1 [Lachancea dasiensis]|uniref:2-(3-amino-3-carboxypropyl)histidine synthase subunit 2 n=1 Tax=Lachancea dasiensis TaxID=1072105 RepID=A0A1G4K496_9SACH|nr:LADA_0H13740g1_1 [Lachancea dasiensis]